jgi:hypothetical protein
LFGLIEEDFTKTKNMIYAEDEGGVEEIKTVLAWCNKNNDLLARWSNSLKALVAIKSMQVLN